MGDVDEEREGGGGGGVVEVGEEKKLRVARTYRTVKNALREIFISDISRNHRFTCNRAASHKLSATLYRIVQQCGCTSRPVGFLDITA